jgi:hypothetical protein
MQPQTPALAAALAALPLDVLARQSGFCRRRPKKIHPQAFLQLCCLGALQARASLSSWAALWGLFTSRTLSKQALARRCSAPALAFLQAVLQTLLAGLCRPPAATPGYLRAFRRVLLQDSTTLPLAPKLAARFPGSRNQTRQTSASLKIQVIFNLLDESFLHFSLTPFTTNDQKAAPLILSVLRAGDLIIRDLGYFVLRVFQDCQAQGACFLSRWRWGVLLSDPQTRQPLDLLARLRTYGAWEGPVLLGAAQPLPVRLVAVPLPPAVAAERRRKLRANRDRRCKPSANQLALLDWEIFITNVPPEVWPASTVAKVYGLRWRIEILFKAWKGHFQLAHLTNGSAEQIQLLIYGRLIWITLFHVHFLGSAPPAGHLSVLKLAAWCRDFLLACLLAHQTPPSAAALRQQISYHCRYEKRRKRRNFPQQLQSLC